MPALARRWSSDALALAILLFVVLLFFRDVLAGPRVLLPVDVLYRIPPWSGLSEASAQVVPHNELIGDAILQNVAWKSFARGSLARGELPLWNPYEFAGMPFMAGGQSGSLYPLGFLFYLLPVAYAYGPFLALHLFLGGAMLYAFARRLGARPAAALVGALGFAFSAFLVVSFTWPMIVSAAVWLPGLLLCEELIVARAECRRSWVGQLALGLVGGVGLALQLLAGHLEISFYVGFCLLFYGVGRLIVGRVPLRALAPLALMALLGPALAAVQLVPFHELIGQNVRAGFVDLPTVLSYALPRAQVVTFLVPDFFGNPSHHQFFSLLARAWRSPPPTTDPPFTIWWGAPKNYVEAASYLGLLPLVLAPLALLRPTRPVVLLAALAILSLALAFGSPLYALFFLAIPGVDQLHTPFRWIYPYSVVVATLAAVGAEQVARRAKWPTDRTRGWIALVGAAFATLGVAGLLAGLAVYLRPAPFAARLQPLLDRSDRLRRAFADSDALLSYEWRNLVLFALFLALSGLSLWLIVRRPARGLPLAAAVVAADLFVALAGFNTRADPTPLSANPPALAVLAADPEPFRTVGFAADAALTPVTPMLRGIEDVRGYDTVVPKRYVEYWSLIEAPQGLPYSKMLGLARVESLASPLLRLLNVRYVVSGRPVDSPRLELVHEGDMRVYRMRDPLPRAFVVGRATVVRNDAEALARLSAPDFDPRAELVLTDPAAPVYGEGAAGSAAFLERSPNRQRLRVDADAPAYLLVSDFYFAGWKARIDGVDAPLFRADHIFRAVPVPAGTHQVELRYRPDSLYIGAAVSGVAGLLALTLGFGLAGRWLLGLREGEGAARRVARNALSGMGTSLVNKAIDFGFAIFMLRQLGAEGIGRYTFAVALYGYLEIVSNFGLNALVIREGAQRRDRLGLIGGSALLLRMLLYLAGLPVVLLVLALWRNAFGLADDTLVATGLLLVALVPGHVAATYSSLFYARERVEVPALLTVATTIAKVGLGLAALLLGYGIVGLAAVALVGNLWTAATLALLARRLDVCRRLEPSRAEALAMLGPAFPLMLNHLLQTLFFKIDVLLLQPLRGDRELGYYATAYKFVDGLQIIPSAFTFAVFPLLSRLGADRPHGMRDAYVTSLKLLVAVSVPIALALTAAASPLVGLIGGPAFLPDGAIALQLLIWFLPLSFANGLTQYALVAAGQQRAITVAFAIAAIFNVAANLVGIPLYGYRAAALVTVLSELVLAIPFGLVVARTIGLSPLRTVAPLLVGGVAALATYLLLEPRVGGLAAFALGIAGYTPFLWSLRGTPQLQRKVESG